MRREFRSAHVGLAAPPSVGGGERKCLGAPVPSVSVRVDKMAKIAKTHEGKRRLPAHARPRLANPSAPGPSGLSAASPLASPVQTGSRAVGPLLGSSAQAAARVMASSGSPGPVLCSALAPAPTRWPPSGARPGGLRGRRAVGGSLSRLPVRCRWPSAAGKPRSAAAVGPLLTEPAPTQAC